MDHLCEVGLALLQVLPVRLGARWGICSSGQDRDHIDHGKPRLAVTLQPTNLLPVQEHVEPDLGLSFRHSGNSCKCYQYYEIDREEFAKCQYTNHFRKTIYSLQARQF